MADQNININYSAADVQRYLHGSMSAKEMHEIERAALQDPFLADAIEGYSEASFEASDKHLNEITALLNAEKNDAKVVVMPKKSFQWFRVAATIILIAGAGGFSWYVFSLNNNAKEKNIAEILVATEKKTDTILPPVFNDTTTLIAQNFTLQKKNSENYKAKDNTIVTPSLRKDEIAAGVVSDDEDKNAGPEIKKNESAETKAAAALTPTAAEPQKPLLNRSSANNISDTVSFSMTAMSMNEFKGRVMDNNKQPIANAIVNAGNQHATYTDASGYFALKAPDSLLNVTVSSIGFVSAQTKLKSNAENNIAIIPNSAALSEVVITGYSTQNKAAKKYRNVDSATPAGGWESFQKYVYKQLGREQDTTLSDQPYNNGIEVEFVINDDGVPYNFKVTGPNSDALAPKAIDIIKQGPKWLTTKKSKKAKVTIPF